MVVMMSHDDGGRTCRFGGGGEGGTDAYGDGNLAFVVGVVMTVMTMMIMMMVHDGWLCCAESSLPAAGSMARHSCVVACSQPRAVAVQHHLYSFAT